jgi:immune inhibitor A
MRRVPAGLAGLALAAGFATTATLSASAAPPDGSKTAGVRTSISDDLPNPAEEKRRELREAALQKVIHGTAKVEQRGASKVVKVGKQAGPRSKGKARATEDQYVELSREKTDKIFVILAEFDNQREPRYPDQDTNPAIPGPSRFDGPLHNQIPEPDRSKNNSTIWQPDYNQAHYQQLYFGHGSNVESVRTYYERQSSGRYSVDGQVSDWVKVPYNEARYGRSDGYPCATIVCSNTWALIKDAIDVWVAGQKAQGHTDEQIAADLKSYDEWDRNDYDADGNFNEADGYIDHFQIVHAGGDQADRDPYQGEDAVWSHRWKAFQNTGEGPANNKDGGTQVGNTGLWVADYTIQPENGGLSVFAHEYGHDLGLPDHYDAATDNAVNWWTLMDQSRVSAAGDQGIGTRPADLGAWDKLQLGWLDYEVVPAGTTRTLDLGPHEYNSAKAQGIVTPLPQEEVVTQLGAPFEGSKQWYSGTGDDLDSTLSRQVTLPAGAATLTFQARWNIEDCGPDACDYAFVEVDDGSGWTAVPGSITKSAEHNGIDGVSGGWKPATFDLSAYAGKTIGLRLAYRTDGAAQGNPDVTDEPPGIFADAFKVVSGTTVVFEDGAENGNNGWTPNVFSIVGATKSTLYDHYYVASNRQYVSYDRYLQSGPYNVLNTAANPNWVEHFPYQNGLLVSYWDTSFSDNNESQHPGQGEILPIDSHPNPIYRLDGKPWRGRIQTYDAPFSLEKADSFTLHAQETGQASYIRGQAAQPVFDDRKEYWNAALPYVGVKVPHVGVRMRVVSASGTSMRVRIDSTTPAG